MDTEFSSLEEALEGYYDKPLSELPDDVKGNVPLTVKMLWDLASADGRRKFAQQADFENDPSYAQPRQRVHELVFRKMDLEKHIDELERRESQGWLAPGGQPSTPTSELESNERMLVSKRNELTEVTKKLLAAENFGGTDLTSEANATEGEAPEPASEEKPKRGRPSGDGLCHKTDALKRDACEIARALPRNQRTVPRVAKDLSNMEKWKRWSQGTLKRNIKAKWWKHAVN